MEDTAKIRKRHALCESETLHRTDHVTNSSVDNVDQGLLCDHGDHSNTDECLDEDANTSQVESDLGKPDNHSNRKGYYDDIVLWSWYGVRLHYEQLLCPVTLQLDVVWFVVMVIAFISRFWHLEEPHRVVFDEVHFGKFASHYIKGTTFFDVHPPLGKLLFALIAYLNGYNGDFSFETIGLEYPRTVPYVYMRGLSALCGFLLVPCVYQIIIELGFKSSTAIVAALLVVCDNGLVIQSRVIMLDSLVILLTTFSLLSFLKFVHLGHRYSWSYQWCFWLLCTGISLGALIGVKYTGLLGMTLIGLLTIADLWQLLGNKLLPLIELLLHLLVRLLVLLGLPFLMNLSFFFIHFTLTTTSSSTVLTATDPQVKLPMDDNSTMIRYGSTFMLYNKEQNCWLHSHGNQYPLKYPDGRGSSYQQQVTCYEYRDENNYWTIRWPASPNAVELGTYRGPVHNNDVVEFIHVGTQRLLNSHDVAGPITPQNQEVAGYINHSSKFVPYLHWKLEVIDSIGDYPIYWSNDNVKLKVTHVQSNQALAVTGERLPEWAYNQLEVITNRVTEGTHARWEIDDLRAPNITNLSEDDISDGRALHPPPPPIMNDDSDSVNVFWRIMAFFESYADLQARMFNAHGSLSEHTFSSRPLEWVWLTKTLPYWLDDHTNAQITLLGNPLLWWIGNYIIIMYPLMMCCYLVRRQRLIFDLPQGEWQQWWISTAILLAGWLLHVAPYMGISRVLFLHHYLPAIPFLCMFTAAMLEHVCYYCSYKRISLLLHITIVTVVLYGFIMFFPFAYGYPALSNEQVLSRQWQPLWHLLYHKTI